MPAKTQKTPEKALPDAEAAPTSAEPSAAIEQPIIVAEPIAVEEPVVAEGPAEEGPVAAEPSTEEQPSQTIYKLLRSVLLAGAGAAAIAAEESEKLVHKLIERGELVESDGKKLLREMQEKRKKSQPPAEEKPEKPAKKERGPKTISATIEAPGNDQDKGKRTFTWNITLNMFSNVTEKKKAEEVEEEEKEPETAEETTN